MTIPVTDSFPPGHPWPGPPGPGEPPGRPGHPAAPGWPAPHREPPAYPVAPPSRVWTGQGDWPGRLYQRLLEQRIVLASGLLDGPAVSVLSAQLLTLDAEGDGPVRLELQGLDAEPVHAVELPALIDVPPQIVECLQQLPAVIHAIQRHPAGRDASHPTADV